MEKQKKEQFILLILALFFLIIFSGIFFRNRPMPNQINMTDASDMVLKQISEPQTGTTAVRIQPSLPEIEPIGAALRDPFDLPLDLQKKFTQDESELEELEYDVKETDLPSVGLQGVVWGGLSPIAFIDGKVYKIGDNVSDAQIMGIDKKGVYFLYHGKKVLMKVKSQK